MGPSGDGLGCGQNGPETPLDSAPARGGTQPPSQVTRAGLGHILGIHPESVSRLVAQGMPVASGGGKGRPIAFDLAACVQWYLARRGSARDDYYRAQTQKVHMENKVRAGELVEAAAVKVRWGQMVTAFREAMLNLTAVAVQRGVVTREHEDRLQALVDDALHRVAERGRG